MKPVSLGSRWLAAIAVGLASVVAQIVAPSLLVTGYAMVTRDGGQIVAFAFRVSEPVALLAAILVTVVGARWAVQRRLAVRESGTAIGAVSALAMVAAALRVHDVDGWTAGAVALLPLAGAVGGWLARRRASRRSAEARHTDERPAIGATSSPGQLGEAFPTGRVQSARSSAPSARPSNR
jgi:hypothetical protein